MKFSGPVRKSQNKIKQINMHLLVTGFFIMASYFLGLLPLALFSIAQTMAVFGKKHAALLSAGVLIILAIAALLTGSAPVVFAAVISFLTVPLFLIVSVLRQKQKSIFLSAGILFVPVFIFFSAVLFSPKLDSVQFNAEIDRVEKVITQSQEDKTAISPENIAVYEKIKDQVRELKKDANLKQFMNYNAGQRLLYFVYGDGFAIFLIIILTFFASLFFLDFAFEQVEKLHAIQKYIKSVTQYNFDPMFLAVLNDITAKSKNKSLYLTENFVIVKHEIDKTNEPSAKNKPFLGILKKPHPENSISFRNYLFHYKGKIPGWGLRSYQMPLILCLFSIIALSSIVFYYGSVPNILNALTNEGILPFSLLVVSVFSMCVLSFLVLQGIFTALKWIPFGVLIVLSIIFLLVSPYILVDLGPFMFLGLFGVVGLLGYLK